jgi:ATP-grasp domain
VRVKRILIVLPDYWARLQLAHSTHWRERFEVIEASPSNEECPEDFDAVGYIERAAREYAGRVDGVMSSSDYPGAQVAAGVAARLGLPGTPLRASMACAHKYYARLAGREAAPEATPPFELIEIGKELRDPAFGYPCFVKPVKGTFSVLSGLVRSRDELHAYLQQPFLARYGRDYLRTFNQMCRELTDFKHGGDCVLAEGVLTGEQVTVEGWISRSEVGVIGITDSIMQPGTRSFVRFEYPSSLPKSVQARMSEICMRVVKHIGLDNTLWNIELFYDTGEDAISIIEINPRKASQFADLYEKVDGLNGFEMAFDVAVGEKPAFRKGSGAFKCAASVPLRVFYKTRVVRVPSEQRIAEVEAAHPGTIIWWECKEGEVLSPTDEFEDGQSRRYGVINLGAQSQVRIVESSASVLRQLAAKCEPV